MSFEKCFRHFLAGSGALPMISQKPSFLRGQGWGRGVTFAAIMTMPGERYRITSSAAANSVSGMVRPSALAIFMLTISSNLVGCSTGRSAGSPL
jgi:hypothetical protein